MCIYVYSRVYACMVYKCMVYKCMYIPWPCADHDVQGAVGWTQPEGEVGHLVVTH